MFFILLSIFNVRLGTNINIIFNSLYTTLILASLGVLGIYLNKVYANTKNRPIYIIDEMINFEED